MISSLTCPVCDRSQLEQNICPNCETDLSTYEMLANLPRQTFSEVKEQKLIIPLWLPVAILFLSLGLVLGFVSNSVIAKQQPPITKSAPPLASLIPEVKPDKLIAPIITEIPQEVKQSEAMTCGGFNYVVRRGDSLSLIASRLYGDRNLWSLIGQANPTIKGRESSLQIGELLFVPNLNSHCQNS